MMNFSETPEFKKDVKRLAKKWRSVPNDVDASKAYILPLYGKLDENVSVELYRQAFFSGKRAAVLLAGEGYEVIKMRLDCESLGTNSKIRIIFVAVKTQDSIEFVELYAKNEKDREDKKRFAQYIK